MLVNILLSFEQIWQIFNIFKFKLLLICTLFFIPALNCQNENVIKEKYIQSIDELRFKTRAKEIPLSSKKIFDEILNEIKHNVKDEKNTVILSHRENKKKIGNLKLIFLKIFINI